MLYANLWNIKAICLRRPQAKHHFLHLHRFAAHALRKSTVFLVPTLGIEVIREYLPNPKKLMNSGPLARTRKHLGRVDASLHQVYSETAVAETWCSTPAVMRP
jgi:hypothetical protein